MIANYHTHTWRCRHAVGKEREYIENAVSAGMKVLGFSDHSPYFFPGLYYSGYRMYPEQVTEYIETLKSLRDEYADRIKIKIGFEAEYYPAYFGALCDFLAGIDYDYLILGQHFIDNELSAKYCGYATDDPAFLRTYVDEVTEGLKTGRFAYLAHPDIICFTGDDAVYRSEMRRLCESAKSPGIPLEINLLGMRDGRTYPRRLFWEIASEVGNTVICGSDAHDPEHTADEASFAVACAMADELSLKRIDFLDI